MDKSGTPFCEREKTTRFRPQETAAKNLLRPLPDSVRLDCHIALTELQFLGDPLRRVFFFLGHRISLQTVVSTEGRLRNRIGPDRVCLIICNSASVVQLASVFSEAYNCMPVGAVRARDTISGHRRRVVDNGCRIAPFWARARMGIFQVVNDQAA